MAKVKLYLDGQRIDFQRAETIAVRYQRDCQSPIRVEKITAHRKPRLVICVYMEYVR